MDEALNERGVLLRTAPHLVHRLPLIVPLEQWWQIPRMWIGTGAARGWRGNSFALAMIAVAVDGTNE